MSAIDVMLERETANDEEALVVAIHVASGAAVGKDDVIFDIENSKATQEVIAPQAGILSHDLAIGMTVQFGVSIARIVPARDWTIPGEPGAAANRITVAVRSPDGDRALVDVEARPAPPSVPAPSRPVAPARFSHAAAALIAEYGMSSADFAGFVTARDVRDRAGAPSPQLTPAVAPAIVPGRRAAAAPETSAAGKPVGAGQAVSRRKQMEIDTLSNGAGQTMLSVLGTTIGPLTVLRESADIMAGRITDLVIYEASRLMRKYARLNAAYKDGAVSEHEAVHAGLAIDDGGRLIVYGIENADRVDLHALSAVIADAVGRYVGNELTPADMSRATFTVTDLSADELDFVLPLLPRGQSCILGITHGEEIGYRIFAGFDHRVTEGREVAAFLGELRDRVRSFGAAVPRPAQAAQCGYCETSLADAVGKGRAKGLMKIVDRDGRDALCCASCWNGW